MKKRDEGTPTSNHGANFDDVPVHTSESLAKRNEPASSVDQVKSMMKTREGQIRILVGNTMDPVKFATVALTAIRAGDDRIRKAAPESLMLAILQAAQRGLSLDPTLGHAYLVAYWNKDYFGPGKGAHEVKYQTGYMGKVFLARREGVTVETFVVHENDKFSIRRTASGNEFEHIPVPLTEDPGEAIGWVARAQFPDGKVLWEVMRRSDVEKIRDTVTHRYGGKMTPAWREWFDEMGRGKAVNRLAKYLPQCPTLQLDARQEDAMDGGAVAMLDAPDDEAGVLGPVVVPKALPAAEENQPVENSAAALVVGSGTGTSDASTSTAATGEAAGASGVVSGKAVLGHYVAQSRTDAGVAPAILAKMLGVTPAVLSGLEKGEIAFTREQALAAAKCLDLHPDDVLAVGGFATESDKPKGNQQDDGGESGGKNSQGGLSFKR